MLQINNLTLYHKKDNRILLNDFSFVLRSGDKAALIGEEGNGKSTLLKAIYNTELIENYVDCTGEIHKQRKIISYLPQQMPEIDLHITVQEYFSRYDLDIYEIMYEYGFNVNFENQNRLNTTLSGGEKVKLQILRILSEKPDIILLDEPTNDLDLEMLIWLENFILKCKEPIIFISHDETLIENAANRIIHIEQVIKKSTPRVTIANIPYQEYISGRQRAFKHQEQLANKEREEYQKKWERWQQIYERVKHEQSHVSRKFPGVGKGLKKKMKSMKVQQQQLDNQKENMTSHPDLEPPMMISFDKKVHMPNGKTIIHLELEELKAGNKILARNISLNVKGSSHICIVGRNGIGKTTFLREISDMLNRREDLSVMYMPQNYDEMLLNDTPIDFLAKSAAKDKVTQCRTFLGGMRYRTDEMDHPANELSGGQKAKLFLLKAVLTKCNVLILDEPTRNFSAISGKLIRKSLSEFGGTIISVSHDRKYIEEVCDIVYTLTEDGLIEGCEI